MSPNVPGQGPISSEISGGGSPRVKGSLTEQAIAKAKAPNEARLANEAKAKAAAKGQQVVEDMERAGDLVGNPPRVPKGGEDAAILRLADNTGGLFGQPTHVITEKPGLASVLPHDTSKDTVRVEKSDAALAARETANQLSDVATGVTSSQVSETIDAASAQGPGEQNKTLDVKPTGETGVTTNAPTDVAAESMSSTETPTATTPTETVPATETATEAPAAPGGDGGKDTPSTTPPVAEHAAKQPESEKKKTDEDIKEQLEGNDRLKRLLRDAGHTYDANKGLTGEEIQAKIDTIKAELHEQLDGKKEWDSDTYEHKKLLRGLEEVRDIADGHEAQRKLEELRNSKEDLTTDEGQAKEQGLLKRIAKGQTAQKVQDIRNDLTEAAKKDESFRDKLKDVRIVPDTLIEDADIQGIQRYITQLEAKETDRTITKSDKKFLDKLRNVVNKAKEKVVKQNVKIAGELSDDNLLELAEIHKHDKGFIGKKKERLDKLLEKYSSAELKKKWNEAKGLSGAIKNYENDKKTATDEEKKNIDKNINIAKKRRRELRGAVIKDTIAKWVALWFLFGPAVITLLMTIGYAKLLQMLKGGGGQ
ncbi:MAG TPA: hypothetical protein VEW42_00110 [Candidatus Eisenbacteria bacterium]|nr:hypothetical protein [Candidatus Eisenbacteria bacterium]